MMLFAQRATAPLHHRSDVEREYFEDPSSQPSLATCLPSQGRRLPGTPYPLLEWSPHRRTAPSRQTLTPCLDPLLSPHNTYHLLQGLTRTPPTMLHYHNICESGRYMINWMKYGVRPPVNVPALAGSASLERRKWRHVLSLSELSVLWSFFCLYCWWPL